MYVSVNGDDNGNGAKENPFATVKRAKEFVRTLDKSKGDITVEIGEGTYELDETISFDVRDSGTDKCRIRYVANGKVILSGGKRLSGEWRSEGNNIYSIELNRNRKLRSLYVNGNRCYMTGKVVKGKGVSGKYRIKKGSADCFGATRV